MECFVRTAGTSDATARWYPWWKKKLLLFFSLFLLSTRTLSAMWKHMSSIGSCIESRFVKKQATSRFCWNKIVLNLSSFITVLYFVFYSVLLLLLLLLLIGLLVNGTLPYSGVETGNSPLDPTVIWFYGKRGQTAIIYLCMYISCIYVLHARYYEVHTYTPTYLHIQRYIELSCPYIRSHTT